MSGRKHEATALRGVTLEGCCAARWYYNLGGAHGHPAASSQRAFDEIIKAKGCQTVNICVTNSNQTRVRNYLRTQGWEEVKIGLLITHVISGTKLRNYLAPLYQEERDRQAEEQKKQQEQREKQRQQEVLSSEARLKVLRKKAVSLKINTDRVLLDDVLKLLGTSLSGRRTKEELLLLEEVYGVRFPHHPNYYYNDDSIHRSLVSLVSRKKLQNARVPPSVHALHEIFNR